MANIKDTVGGGRFLATLMLVATYCIIALGISFTGCWLMHRGNVTGKDLVVFMIGNFTGTAMGAVIAYFFKGNGQQEVQK